MSVSSFDEITKTEPEKSLTSPLKKTGGRNVNGRITRRHAGGGHKRRYRESDFKRTKDGVPAQVAAIEDDPDRAGAEPPPQHPARHNGTTPAAGRSADGEAGGRRGRGKRPTVRGPAMSPVDHPHGGGEGKSKGGRPPVTPWGVPTLGKRTRRKHKESDKLIVRSRRRGKEKR